MVNIGKTLKNLCTPAQIYLGIAVFSALFSLMRGTRFGIVFMRMLFAVFWTFILGWLCKKGYTSISWFLVLLPYIMLFLISLRIANFVEEKVMMKNIGMQGVYGLEGYEGVGTKAGQARRAARREVAKDVYQDASYGK
jgi:hypothetical protein